MYWSIFKTDHVANPAVLAERYEKQMRLYAKIAWKNLRQTNQGTDHLFAVSGQRDRFVKFF